MKRAAAVASPALLAVACAAAWVVAGGCALHAPVASDIGGNAEAPHAVRLRGGKPLVAWGAVHSDGRADILLASDPTSYVRVNPSASSAVAGRQVGPRIAITPSGRVLVSWVDRGRDPAGDILLAASHDGGRTFGAPRRVNDDAGLTGQEYQDIAVLPDGTAVLVWLDERGAGTGDENQKQVYFASSADGGETFSVNEPLTSSPSGVCPCCRPGVCASADGSTHVIYRDRIGDELLLRVRSRARGQRDFGEAVTVSGKGWRFPACPVDGPTLLDGASGELRAAWMDGSSGKESLWTAVSKNGGGTFEPAQQLVPRSSSSSGRAVLARMDLGPVAAWEDESGRIWIRLLDQPEDAAIVVAGGEERAARSPQLSAAGDSVIVYWTETNWREARPENGALPPSRLAWARLMAQNGALILAP